MEYLLAGGDLPKVSASVRKYRAEFPQQIPTYPMFSFWHSKQRAAMLHRNVQCKNKPMVALVVQRSKAHVLVRTATRLRGFGPWFQHEIQNGVPKKGFSFQGFFWLQVGDLSTCRVSPEQ